MSSAKTQPARGMRDFLPADVRKRDYVIGVIKQVYESYGFEPLETPAVENIETLMGKYGEEGNQLIFKILKRGEHESTGQADLALRYDLTVPLARVVAEYRNDLPKFFKRYQIQPVWRADRPARGRFREFYQCDVDALGSQSMVVEAELCSAATSALEALARLLEFFEGLARVEQSVTQIGTELNADSPHEAANLVVLDRLTEFVGGHVAGTRGTDELRQILELSRTTRAGRRLKIDPSLARGLSYYTGAIMEISVADLPGSLGGGGRYDNLVGMFSGQNVPACGFSLGLERILVVMDQRGMFPDSLVSAPADVMDTIWNAESIADSLRLADELREQGLRADVYPEADKLGKQFKYAATRGIPTVAVLGDDERAQGNVSIKNLKSGVQTTVGRAEAAEHLLKNRATG